MRDTSISIQLNRTYRSSSYTYCG